MEEKQIDIPQTTRFDGCGDRLAGRLVVIIGLELAGVENVFPGEFVNVVGRC